MTNSISKRGLIFESCMETQFPITSMLIAIGSGLDLILNENVFEDYQSFGNALSVGLDALYFMCDTGLTPRRINRFP